MADKSILKNSDSDHLKFLNSWCTDLGLDQSSTLAEDREDDLPYVLRALVLPVAGTKQTN